MDSHSAHMAASIRLHSSTFVTEDRGIMAKKVAEALQEPNVAAIASLLYHFDPVLVVGLAHAAVNLYHIAQEIDVVTKPERAEETPRTTRLGQTRRASDIFFHLMRQHCVYEGIAWH